MQKILVPTDFSECADHAADAAIKLAKFSGAEVHFYHRAYYHPQWELMSETERESFPESLETVRQVKTQFKALNQRYQHSGVKRVINYAPGELRTLLSQYIETESIELVVMGSHGAHGLQQFVFGSNAQRMIKAATCPVLVIKHALKTFPFQNIVFASDFREPALEPFDRLVEMARLFGAHLHLLSIVHTLAIPRWFQHGDLQIFADRCGEVPVTQHTKMDPFVEHGIRTFVQDNQTDLVAIVNYPDPIIPSLKSSLSRALANHFDLPVLVMNS